MVLLKLRPAAWRPETYINISMQSIRRMSSSISEHLSFPIFDFALVRLYRAKFPFFCDTFKKLVTADKLTSTNLMT